MKVRAYKQTDKSAVQNICHKTATAKKYQNSKALVNALYCDYYIENEPENCFVLTDEFDNAVGYILCSTNRQKYKKDFNKYLLFAKKVCIFDYIAFKFENILIKSLIKEYPAHLHINIMPSFQRKGGGKLLIDSLINHLKETDCKGVIFGVSAKNLNAIKFYEKLNFKIKKTFLNKIIYYGLKIK